MSMTNEFPSALLHLIEKRTWICWKWAPIYVKDPAGGGRKVPKLDRNGSPLLTKVPCDIGGGTIDNTDRTQHRTYGQIWDAIANDVVSGAGIAMTGNEDGSLLILDLDKCRDRGTGELDEWARGVVEACASYCEVSPSGTGLRIIGGSGGWPTEETNRRWWTGHADSDGAIGKGETFFRTMFATVTFNALPGYERLWSDIGWIAASLDRRPGDANKGPDAGNGTTGGTEHASGNPLAPVEVVRETLGVIPNEGPETSWDRWQHVGMCVFRATEGDDEGLDAWTEWSSRHPAHEAEDTCFDRWEHWRMSSPPTRCGYGTLHKTARESEKEFGRRWSGGPAWKAWKKEQKTAIAAGMGPVPAVAGTGDGGIGTPVPPTGASMAVTVSITGGVPSSSTVGAVQVPVAAQGSSLPAFADEMLARGMVDRWGDRLRYVAPWGKWMLWTESGNGGGAWKQSERGEGRRAARETCSHAAENMAASLAPGLLSFKTIRAVEDLAKVDARVASGTEEWDTDPWLLNTPGGVLDLREGGVRPADRGLLLTKTTTATPDFTAMCPLWRTFLGQVTKGDEQLQSYLARVAGYCLTGDVREHALFFLYGEGSNGKGTFLNTLAAIMGNNEYARNAGAETFTAGKSDQHLTEIARLRGARMVVTTEVEEGRAWAESRIKMLTGGDPVTARFMHQDHFTFMPQFKLLFAGNHKPRIRAVNEANRRRMNLIPFLARFSDADKDMELGAKLMHEAPGILAWAVVGCREWLRIGLNPPKSVVDATNRYVESEDTRAAWMNDCCVWFTASDEHPEGARGKTLECRPGALFDSWRAWAERAQEFVGTQRSFMEWMRQHGFDSEKNTLGQNVVKNIQFLTMGAIDTNTGKSNVPSFAVVPGGKTN